MIKHTRKKLYYKIDKIIIIKVVKCTIRKMNFSTKIKDDNRVHKLIFKCKVTLDWNMKYIMLAFRFHLWKNKSFLLLVMNLNFIFHQRNKYDFHIS